MLVFWYLNLFVLLLVVLILSFMVSERARRVPAFRLFYDEERKMDVENLN